jgi:hypothetical protein
MPREVFIWATTIGFTALYCVELIGFCAASVHGGDWLLWFGALCTVSATIAAWYICLRRRRAIRLTLFVSILVGLALIPAAIAITVVSLPWYQPS